MSNELRIIQYSSTKSRVLADTKVTAALIIFLTLQLVSPLAGIQCFDCKDQMRQEFSGLNSTMTSGKHLNHCGTLTSTGRRECPGTNLCSKVTVFYQQKFTSPVEQVIRRSCWDTPEKIKLSGRNYSTGNCYWDYGSRPYETQICVCDADYCNSQDSGTPPVFPIQIIALLILTHFWHRMPC